jgi:uncharacterized protein
MPVPCEFSSKLPEIAAIGRRFQVQRLSLFGSSVGPEFRTESDFDLLVDFVPGAEIGLIRFGLLEQERENLLGRRVDLVPKFGLKPFIGDTVLESSVPVYAG